MHDYALTHLADDVLLRDLAMLVQRDRATTAMLLAHIAEVDARRLYVAAGYASMFAYCTEALRLSEDAAYKRIRAARAARRFPVLFTEMAAGRLHMAAVCVLSPHLNAENLAELREAATHRRKSEIEEWLVHRFPGAAATSRECAPVIRPIRVDAAPIRTESTDQLVLGPVPDASEIGDAAEQASKDGGQQIPATVESEECLDELVPGPVAGPEGRSPVTRFLVRLTIDESTHDKLRRAQALLSHVVPGGDVAAVFDRALDALLKQAEKRKTGATSRNLRPERIEGGGQGGARSRSTRIGSSTERRSTARSRYIPAKVRRAVWERDQGRCTFVSASGHRCGARQLLEFDHVEPVARGGRATVEGMRLRCRAHNQYEAERAFGAEFMGRKRREARQREQAAWAGEPASAPAGA